MLRCPFVYKKKEDFLNPQTRKYPLSRSDQRKGVKILRAKAVCVKSMEELIYMFSEEAKSVKIKASSDNFFT